MTNTHTRRRFLRSTGLVSLSLLARCSRTAGSPSPEQGSDSDGFSKETRKRAETLGKKVRQSVVKILDEDMVGTGWVADDGYLLTNSHIVQDATTFDIETFDERTGIATRVGFHRDLLPDIALLKTGIETPLPLSTEVTATLSKGDPLLSVGHPGKVGDWVIGLGRYDSINPRTNWLLADIPTGDGSSGSPLLTLDGGVVGCIHGTTPTKSEIHRLDRPDSVFTAYPEKQSLATATPARTITKWLAKWQ
ncbi:S1 family peptidase [Haladaptatus halobius]|uniref:S1 family peptidase n=1 Tax=Haladaptatus halobius TaxID=2884875 RepID=UPI001D0ABB85|nr:serine protease [Haladaptatus halobius]